MASTLHRIVARTVDTAAKNKGASRWAAKDAAFGFTVNLASEIAVERRTAPALTQ